MVMHIIPDQNMEDALQSIEQASGEELEKIAWAVVNRYEELYPDYVVGLLSLPAHDPEGRRRKIEELLEFLEKKDSLG